MEVTGSFINTKPTIAIIIHDLEVLRALLLNAVVRNFWPRNMVRPG